MPTPDPQFLDRGAVDELHQESLAEFGGASGVRSETGIESAIAAPINDYLYSGADLFEIAAAYAYHIA